MNLGQVKALDIPTSPGCYQYFDSQREIIYVGKAANLKSRVLSYWQKSAQHTPAKERMLGEIAKIEWIEVDTEIEAFLLEANLIKKYQPKYNILLRDDKRFSYIKISTEDEVPGVLVTRQIDKAGRYFGPYTSATAVREVLKVIRKIWPYCTERKISAKSCFQSHIGLCTGVCGGDYILKDYKGKVIKPIIQFLSGEKKKVVREMEKEIADLEKRLDKAKKLVAGDGDILRLEAEIRIKKFRLANFQNVLEHSNILSVHDKYAADVVELAKLFSLPKIPERIEGYDISNIFGEEAVGSMVVFKDGEPDKNEYRKFKIKNENGGDTDMLREVLERRIRHSFSNDDLRFKIEKNIRQSTIDNRQSNWPLPDLIIIDGGKGQLSTVVRILKKNKIDMPVIAISKGEGLRSAKAPDKLFFPGQSKPLELPLASPALHLVKRVRDEAHRFAIGFHRSRKRKRIFN